jgi:serine/threonine-protein kinase
MAHAADRNLLLGIIALQMDFITRDALIAAMNSWVLSKLTPLSQILQGQAALSEPRRSLLEALVEEHIRLHDGDPEKSLASVSSIGSVREQLMRIADPDLQASLPHVATVRRVQEDDTNRAVTSTVVGESTSHGNRFLILRPHAKGGLGEVFVARDTELNRDVAVKEIQSQFAFDACFRSRFEFEAEVTGGLEHPGIVPVYGLGHLVDGRPFYAMRFIKGSSLKDAIRSFHEAERQPGRDAGGRSLELRDLLSRFMDVCDAIAYAHSRGVLHRDLKPGNVMLGKFGETLLVDWGLAKTVGDQDGPALAAGGEPALHPSSGTQLEPTRAGSAVGTPGYMSPEQVDNRLGAVGIKSDVYSLGATLYHLLTSHAPCEAEQIGEVYQKVLAGEIPRPRSINPRIALPLEAVCLKALALNPEDRYVSASALKTDVERWLADEPVTAWREHWGARAARWARRHRSWVAAAAATLLVVSAVSSAAAMLIDRSLRKERVALLREKEAVLSERAAKAEAQEGRALAREAVDDYFTKISENALLQRQDAAEVRDLRTLRKDLLEVALAYYNRLVALPTSDASLRAAQAVAATRVARINREVGSRAAALSAYQQALGIRIALADPRPSDGVAQRELAASRIDLAVLLAEIGRAPDALAEYAQSELILEPLADANPADAQLQSQLANVFNGQGLALRLLSRPIEALAAFERGRTILARLDGAGVADTQDRSRLAKSESNVGMLLYELGRSQDAVAALERSRIVSQRLVDGNPTVSRFQSELAACYNNIGMVHIPAGRTAEALTALARGREILRRLVAAHPSVTDYRRDLAENFTNLGTVHSEANHPREALPEFEQARRILQPLVDANPTDADFRRDLGTTLFNIGDALRATHQFASAKEPAEQACAVLGMLSDRAPFDEFVIASAHHLWADALDKSPGTPTKGDQAQREQHALLAMEALGRAIAGGFRAIDAKNFSALQSRRDFQDLMRDFDFPEWPFAAKSNP